MNPDDLTAAPTEPRRHDRSRPHHRRPARRAPAARAAAPSAQGHAITLRKLNAFYGETHAVKEVDLDYAANRVTAMIGPSGCGKSTLVRCINRMHEEIPGARAKGEVRLDDLDLYDDGRRRRQRAARRSGWSSRSPTRSRPCRSSTTSPRACASAARAATRASASSSRCAEPGCGRRSRTASTSPASGSPAASSSGSASRGRSPWSPRSSSWTSRARPWTRSPRSRSRSSSTSSSSATRSSSSPTTCSRRRAWPTPPPSCWHGEMIEHAATDKIFSKPDDSRTEEYVTGKFG